MSVYTRANVRLYKSKCPFIQEQMEQRLIMLAIINARESGLGITADSKLELHASDYAKLFNVSADASYKALRAAVNNRLDNEYTAMSDFKKRVLEPSIKQINEHTDITVTYEQHLIMLAIINARESGLGITADSKLEIHASDYAKLFNVSADA